MILHGNTPQLWLKYKKKLLSFPVSLEKKSIEMQRCLWKLQGSILPVIDIYTHWQPVT